MSKTDMTKQLERDIWIATQGVGVYGCFEVTIGIGGNERVDYMTMDSSHTFRCYEIKVSKADFNSSAAISFVGNFNYYVMPGELYEAVKDSIPAGIGVYIGQSCKKRASYQPSKASSEVLMDSLIRSLAREVQKNFKSESREYIQGILREKQRAISDASDVRGELRRMRAV